METKDKNAIIKEGSFTVEPCDDSVHPESDTRFMKLEQTEAQDICMAGLASQLPTLCAANAMSNMYVLHFPEGVSGHLLKLRDGRGFTTTIVGENGKFSGTAWLTDANTEATIFSAFSVMAMITQQYFLTEITTKLGKIEMGIDKILEFLYGNKKAELIAEVTFTKFAMKNYISVMKREAQKIATIQSLQNGKKIAMKDIEFYMNELNKVTKEKENVDILLDKACRIKECLELSIQLYVMNTILEVYYAENLDSGYLKYVENEAEMYISKCERRILSRFSELRVLIAKHKDTLLKKLDQEALLTKVNQLMETYETGEESKISKTLHHYLELPVTPTDYYISKIGDVYMKKAQ